VARRALSLTSHITQRDDGIGMRTRRAVALSYAWRPRPYRTAPPRSSEARSPLEIQGQRPSLSRESPGILMHPAGVPGRGSRSPLRRDPQPASPPRATGPRAAGTTDGDASTTAIRKTLSAAIEDIRPKPGDV
jgi:hypothetical protein